MDGCYKHNSFIVIGTETKRQGLGVYLYVWVYKEQRLVFFTSRCAFNIQVSCDGTQASLLIEHSLTTCGLFTRLLKGKMVGIGTSIGLCRVNPEVVLVQQVFILTRNRPLNGVKVYVHDTREECNLPIKCYLTQMCIFTGTDSSNRCKPKVWD